MNIEELRGKIQIAISKPENKYKTAYAQTADKKDWLHIWMIDTRKASEQVIVLLKELRIIPAT